MKASLGGLAALLWLALAGPAGAIVGGTEEAGPLARASVMVLSSKGGVCSAVVVARDAVLTAAHCASGADQYRVHWRGEDGQPVLIEPAAIAVHPGYDRKAVEARRRSIDLAVVRLPEPLPSRFEVAVLSGAKPQRDETLSVGGYGVSREGDGRSSGTYRQASVRAIEPYGPSTILVWAEGDAAGACQGDSGGPITRSGQQAVAAVATWSKGPKGRLCGALTQGVLVGPQRAWIDGVLQGWSRSARWE
jgi:hypothetical protein